MTHRIDIVKAEGYLHITFSGPFSPEAARRSVDEMAAACKRERCENVLFDCRPMSGDLSVMNRFEVAEYGALKIPYSVKIAMLGRIDQTLPDNFFENVARNRGVTLTVFTDIDKAIKWLKE